MAIAEPETAPPLATMEAKMIVATSSDQCQQLMDHGLLSVACSGSWKKLQSFLQGPTSDIPSSTGILQQPSRDQEALVRESFLDGVTAEGDTFLHVMATKSVVGGGGGGEDLIKADNHGIIHRKAVEFLSRQNKNEDTPLHCAARAANSQMVSFLVQLSRGNNTVKALLEKENKRKWTALHEAVHVGNNDIVKVLMEEDSELASRPKDGTSPMYLAILLEDDIIAKTLHKMSGGVLSYSGPNGQNALHAAVLQGPGKTEMLLGWDNTLTIQQDKDGSTPLHFAASVAQGAIHLLLKANPNQLYQPDNAGIFPIHVAATVGKTFAIRDFLKKSPYCAGLRDARGRTFLHVAVDKMKTDIVSDACENQYLSWILNMQDNDGNTALHLAVKAGNLIMFCALYGNRQVHLSLSNEKEKTPLDLARCNLPKGGLYYTQNPEVKILRTLAKSNAKSGICRQDYLKSDETIQARQDERNILDTVKDSTQNLSIGSVLIATVTFGAIFAMPGGYRAEDHINGGTPTLAGRYAFDAFILANVLAFAFSLMATVGLMSSGSPMYSLPSRVANLNCAFNAMFASVACLVAAFALATYIMLAPVAHLTAVTVCVLSSLIYLYTARELAMDNAMLFPAKYSRKGRPRSIIWTFPVSLISIANTILANLWPMVLIFGLATVNYYIDKKWNLQQNHRHQ